YSGSNKLTLIERWNGKSWSIVSSPNVGSSNNNYLLGITAISASNAWALGSLIAHWDGTSRSMVTTPMWCGGEEDSVARIPGTYQFWAVGIQYMGYDFYGTLTQRYMP